MSQDLKHTIYSSTDCLSEKILFDYIDNNLSQKERHFVEKHLIDCELCSDALEGLELVKDRGRIQLINQAIEKRLIDSTVKEGKIISFNYKIVFSIAATIALLIGGVFLFNNVLLKETAHSDMAELKKEDNAAAPAPSDVIKLDDSASGEKDEKEKSAPGKMVDQESAHSESTITQKNNYKTEISKKGHLDEPKDFEEQETYVNLREEANKGEGAEQNPNTISTKSSEQLADEAPVLVPEKSTTSRNKNVEREIDSKLEMSKKAEDKSATTSGTTTRTAAPNVSQNQKDNAVGNGAQPDLAKKSDRSEKSRSVKKGKEKAAASEDIRMDEDDQNFGGVVGYAPPNVAQETDGLKSESNTSIGSIVTDSTEQIFTIVDQMPEFPGGKDSMLRFIAGNFKYVNNVANEPVLTKTKIYVQFIIGKDGALRNPKIVRGINASLDKEAIRVVKMMPKWKPGKQNGKPVSVSYIIPIQLEIK